MNDTDRGISKEGGPPLSEQLVKKIRESGMFNEHDQFKGFPSPNSLQDNYTTVPNGLFRLLPLMGEAELKVVLHIIKQTYGWLDHKASQESGTLVRKRQDYISYSQFHRATGLSSASISRAIRSLLAVGVISKQETTGMPFTPFDIGRAQLE
ncbi:MAG: hypothetical protein ACYC9Q_09015 [Bacillota bacterium]